jgi:acyl-coenzyme A thioesterase PaaI-like protein
MGELLPVQTENPGCFCCGRENPAGIKLRFTKESATTVATRFTTPREWSGWGEILHGGFQALLLDEAMAWAAWGLRGERNFVTKEMTVTYYRPAHVARPLVVTGLIEKDDPPRLHIRGEIRDDKGVLLTRSIGVFVRVDPGQMAAMSKPAP